jgi:spore germination cell wall hydrolase CwlJ-like protein
MIAVVRAGVVAGCSLLAALVATPSYAAETPVVPTSLATPASIAQVASASLLPAQTTLPVQQTAPAVTAPATLAKSTPSLRDLVISYVDRRDQDAEQQCLAQAVFFEARGESLEGQLAVAQVVLNRAASGTFPSSICAVVTQPAQFSFVRRGRIPEADRTSDCWHKALAIADIARKRALANEVASNVLWYHATYVSPSWGRQKTRFAQIGSHIFYS